MTPRFKPFTVLVLSLLLLFYKLFVRRARESLGQNYCEGTKRKKKQRKFVGRADERRRREEFESVFSRKVAAASEVRVKGAEFLHL